jgi:hypothetical protein
MVQPRPYLRDISLCAEASFIWACDTVMEAVAFTPEDAQLIEPAWEALKSSGVLQKRNIDGGIESVKRGEDQLDVRAARRVATHGLCACALAACGAREVHATQFKKCAACQGVVYCCKAHQEADWPAHKAACKAARKAAAAAADA